MGWFLVDLAFALGVVFGNELIVEDNDDLYSSPALVLSRFHKYMAAQKFFCRI